MQNSILTPVLSKTPPENQQLDDLSLPILTDKHLDIAYDEDAEFTILRPHMRENLSIAEQLVISGQEMHHNKATGKYELTSKNKHSQEKYTNIAFKQTFSPEEKKIHSIMTTKFQYFGNGTRPWIASLYHGTSTGPGGMKQNIFEVGFENPHNNTFQRLILELGSLNTIEAIKVINTRPDQHWFAFNGIAKALDVLKAYTDDKITPEYISPIQQALFERDDFRKEMTEYYRPLIDAIQNAINKDIEVALQHEIPIRLVH